MKDINEIYNLIREKGDRLTTQKKILLGVLHSNMDKVMAVSDIIKKLPKSASMDDATIYRNIQRLMQLKVLESFVDESGVNRYVISCHSGHHHHMICVSCGKIFEIPCQNDFWDKYAKENGFEETYHKLEVYGKCMECKNMT